MDPPKKEKSIILESCALDSIPMSTSQKTQVIDEKSEQDFGTEIESIDLTTKLTNETKPHIVVTVT